ncbi:O-succinylhomoserine sulfhydrylase [Rhizomicrobium electricum]|uniref:O-succinylhomoserine sulfhydrylase n=1 Tax=Rhizomicrobium electricum TaxID=480070 RepID=A0ABP3PIV9_9PROT|nr:O-succinylhomoserine sulfhydrylase [Rhizomicrobium electricum]NIJ47124.1 O-succinylhomoserine sulfhydrylase [Rhizomicrobium electricum]
MATQKNPKNWRPRTLAVRGGQIRTPFQETAEALFLTSGYAYDGPEEPEARFKGEADGYTYSRYGNPTVAMFEARMAALEGAPVARATASGMAAVSSVFLSALRSGDHVVAARAMFGACRLVVEDILARFGITSTIVDGTDLDAWQKALTPATKMLFLETPANPTLAIADLRAIAEIADKAGARLVVDNAFASPALQRPMQFGAHIVVHSSTKYIDGQGRAMGGVILCREDFLAEHLQTFLRNTGPIISPFNAWLHLKSLETLDLRMRAHCENARAVADFLAEQKGVHRVLYPFRDDHPQVTLAKAQMDGGGGVVAFEIDGGKAEAFALERALKLIDISNNLGDAKSLITHPATTTHCKLTPEARAAVGVSDGMLRLAVGLEDPADLCDDLAEALRSMRK